jgi:hypothetical protein
MNPSPETVSSARRLRVTMFDTPSGSDDEVNLWIDNDLVPQMLSSPSFTACERLQLTGVEPPGSDAALRWTKYLNLYALGDVTDAWETQPPLMATFTSRWAQGRRGSGSPNQAPRSRSLEAVFTRLPDPWTRASSVQLAPPRALLVMVRDVDAGSRDELNRYLDEEFVPEQLGIPGFLHAVRYEVEPTAFAARTSDGTSLPRYVELFEIASPEVVTSSAFRAVQAAPTATTRRFGSADVLKGYGVYVQRPSPWAVSFADRRGQ